MILFVCSGNICRSPFAEVAARGRLGDAVEVSSAGTLMTSGNRPTAEAIAVAGELGFDLSGHRSRPATESVLRGADVVLVMDRGHLRDIAGIAPDLDPELLDPEGEIADPYGRPREFYRVAYRRILDAVDRRLGEWGG